MGLIIGSCDLEMPLVLPTTMKKHSKNLTLSRSLVVCISCLLLHFPKPGAWCACICYLSNMITDFCWRHLHMQKEKAPEKRRSGSGSATPFNLKSYILLKAKKPICGLIWQHCASSVLATWSDTSGCEIKCWNCEHILFASASALGPVIYLIALDHLAAPPGRKTLAL